MLIKDIFSVKIKEFSVILPYMVNKSYELHNGRINKQIRVSKRMVGFKFGSYILTRKVGKIHKIFKIKSGKGVRKKK